MRNAVHLLAITLLATCPSPCSVAQSAAATPSAQTPSSSNPAPVPSPTQLPPAPAVPARRLTREDAERMALVNNPRVSISHLLALAQHQVVRQARSGELPTLTGSVTAQDANDGSRVSSGLRVRRHRPPDSILRGWIPGWSKNIANE